jgi:hypothetical protein
VGRVVDQFDEFQIRSGLVILGPRSTRLYHLSSGNS